MTSMSGDNQDNDDDNDRCNDDKSADSCNYDNKRWTQYTRLRSIYRQQLIKYTDTVGLLGHRWIVDRGTSGGCVNFRLVAC